MFKFTKATKGVSKQEVFECECCGSMESNVSTGSSGCSSGCGSAKSLLGAPMESFSGENNPDKPKTATESGCKSSCSGK
jgi:hypothetical protein